MKYAIYFGVFVGILTGLCIFDLLQISIFRQSSIDTIKSIQENDPQTTINFFRFIFVLGDVRCYLVFLMILFNLLSRQTSFYLAFVLSFGLFLCAFLKLAFQSGRPFMTSQKIFPYVCQLSFGNPSAESMNITAFFIVLSLYTYHKIQN